MVAGSRKRRARRTGSDVAARLDGLQVAVDAARGRLDDRLADDAAEVLERAGGRLRLSADHTVVALAGATGSGKSSLFNAISGLDLSAVGVRRPTTSTTMACVWGAEDAGALLDWLGVPKRHQVERESTLDEPDTSPDSSPDTVSGAPGEEDLHGLVLLDLPDHDSVEVSHHVEVDRLVAMADLLVWVLDPQKYADAALHERYLTPLRSHAQVMLVVLNQTDTVAADRLPGMLDDLRRILADDGLDGVTVLATSAATGAGMPALRQEVAARVAAKEALRARIRADAVAVAMRMRDANGDAHPGEVAVARSRKQELVDSFADAAAVPTVVRAVEASTLARARRATGWPLTAWLSKLRPDPLKRLHLGRGAGKELATLSRTSVPQASPVQRARVDSAVRAVSDDVSDGLTRPWAAAVRRASVSRLHDLHDALDTAVAGADLRADHTPLWWQAVRAVQRGLILVVLAGALWLGVLAVMGYLQLPAPGTPDFRGFPVPTLMLVGGVLVGVLLALGSRLLAGVGARAKARAVDRSLRTAIGEVTQSLVVEPIETEVAAYRSVREGLAAALG